MAIEASPPDDPPVMPKGVLHNPVNYPTASELLDELEARLGGTC